LLHAENELITTGAAEESQRKNTGKASQAKEESRWNPQF
jgi:hypothetical protein